MTQESNPGRPPGEPPHDDPTTLGDPLPASRRSFDTTPGPPAPPWVEENVGPYRILQLLGEGGFGAVYLAEQSEPVKRRVALKVIKPGMDTRQVLARFEQERQALAIMDHPGIARVLDAGTTELGRPYFVMELVKGEPITVYADRNALAIRERLELFEQVCVAVQHAHSKGLIHRDLKPSNVLVTSLDGQPRAKVIDFGIAKATAGNLTDRTLFTEHRQMIGTPEYMSPEQAEGSLDIDTRTDVYALGVLLYELLTGSTPFDPRRLREAAYVEILRIIREDDPPTPSIRLAQSVATLDSVAARRHVEPRKLASILKGDLDWIAMKALEKDRQRRYETANGLAMDIRRYLAGEAVLAAPQSAAYRLSRFVRRHRVGVAATGLVAASLVAAGIGIAWQAKVARAEARKAERIAEFMSETLRGVGPSVALGRDTTMLREMMAAAAARIEKGDLAASPRAELYLRGTIGTTFRELALFDEAQRMLAPAVPLARSLHRGDHQETAKASSQLAQLFNDRGESDAAEPLYREALAMDRRLLRGDHPSVATDLNNLASLLEDRGDPSAAEPVARQALEMRRRLYSGDHEEVAESLNNLATILGAPTGLGDLESAEALFREALAMNRRLLPADHPRLAAGINNLSVVLGDLGDAAGAEALARESLEIRRRLFPGDHPYVATGLGNLALLIQDRGDLVAPEALLRESLAMRRRLFPGGHVSVANDLANLGRLLLARDDPEAAVAAYREAASIYESTQGDAFWPTGNAHLGLGRSLTKLGRHAEAERELLHAERLLATAPSTPPARKKQCLEALVSLYEAWERAAPGRGHGEKAAPPRVALETLAALAQAAETGSPDPPGLSTSAAFADDGALRAELRAFVEVHRGGRGVVVGLLEGGERRLFAHGTSGRRERPVLDGATRFEIGSITKTFTGALFAELALAGELELDERVAALFPPGIALDNGAGEATLEGLATHTSGLPRLALDWRSLPRLFSSDPYRGSSAEEIFGAVARVKGPIRPSAEPHYSNLGFALLGRLLERRAEMPFEELLRGRLLEPLGLSTIATRHVEPPPIELARGHGPGGRPADYWHVDGYAPAGGLVASADEMLDYLSRQLEGAHPALVEAGRLRRTLPDGSGIGLAWMHDRVGEHRLVWHNGGTGGFRSFAGFLPDEGRALVVLANGQGDVDALARRLLDSSEPSLPKYDAGALGIALTVLLLAWGPVLLAIAMQAARRSAAVRGRAAGAVGPPERLAFDRFDALRRPLSPAIALLLAERIGAWYDLDFALWWAALGVSAAAAALLLLQARPLPWLRPGRLRLAARSFGTLFELAVLALLLA